MAVRVSKKTPVSGIVFVHIVCEPVNGLVFNQIPPGTVASLPGGWNKAKVNKVLDTANANYTPREQAALGVYQQDGFPYVPLVNILRCLHEAGQYCKLTEKGRTQISTQREKRLTQLAQFYPYNQIPWLYETEIGGSAAPWEVNISPVRKEDGKLACQCVPRFDRYLFETVMKVNASAINLNMLRTLWDFAGEYIGIGLGRPAKGGLGYGQFRVKQWNVVSNPDVLSTPQPPNVGVTYPKTPDYEEIVQALLADQEDLAEAETANG